MNNDRRGRAANGRSSIYRDADGHWHGWVSMGSRTDGRPIRRHVRGKTQADVTRKVRALESERDTGGQGLPGRKPTLDSYLERWIERRERLGTRPKTITGYRVDAGHVKRSVGGNRLDRLTPAHIEELWASMVRAGVLASVRHVRRTLNACLNDAVSEGLLVRNPVKPARVPKYDPPEIEPYTVDEVRKFLAAAAERRNAARWIIAVVLGLRQGEVLALRWVDVDLDAGTLTVRRQLQRLPWRHGCADPSACRKRGTDCPQRHGGGLAVAEPKSRAGRRTISLPASLVAALTVHRKAQLAERLAAAYWEDNDLVFATEWGSPIDSRCDWAEFKQVISTAGLRDARLHDLRHSAATLMLEADTDLQTAGQILGHGSIAQTSQYTHILADRKRAAAARIETLVWGDRTSSL